MDDCLVDNAPSVALIQCNDKYELQERVRLRNDLLLIIGYLEFFNALDFPANVWNSIPVPTFAVGLMATGGSIALLSSGFAFFDLRRSLRNIKLLRKERTYLQEQYSNARTTSPRRRHIQAWLSLNYRELGWELIDRSLMDAMVGFAAILIGVGTLMAIGGANPRVYLASNLLSGYIGNSFVAAYSLANVSWSVYLYIRARRHKRFFRQGTADRIIRARADCVFRNHQIYAVVNAITLLVSGAGSLVSATMWYGYVIIIPTILFSVFCNIFWRKRVGYNRILTQFRTQEVFRFDFYRHIEDAVSIQDQIKSEVIGESLKLLSSSELLQFVVDNEMLEDLALYIANDESLLKALLGKTSDSTLMLRAPMLESMDRKALVNAVQAVAESQGLRRALDRERMLFELLGAYWHAEEKELADSQRRRSIEAAASTEIKNIEVDSEESGSGEEEAPCHSAQDRAQEHQLDIQGEKAPNY